MIAAGCTGGVPSPTSPTGAPPALGAPAPIAGGATITGVVTGVAPGAVLVSVAGTTLSGVVDVGGLFSLTNVPAIDVVLAFTGPDVNATLPLGTVADSDQIRLTVTLSSTTVTLESQQRTGLNQSVELEGLIDTVDPANRQLVVNKTMVSVPAGAVIKRGDAVVEFSDLAAGDRALIRGVKNGEVVVASHVLVRERPPTPPLPPARATFSGEIVGLAGRCPSLSLKVGETYVKTNSETTFRGKKCEDVEVGDKVVGVGTKQPEGVVLAEKVEVTVEAPAPERVTFSGAIVGLSGSCPFLTLKVGETYVKTSGETTFKGKKCEDIKAGDKAAGVGAKQPDGTVLAEKIEVAEPPPSPVSFSGTVIGFEGSCPSLRVKVGSVYVRTDSATTFKGKGCAALKVGSEVGGVGTKQPDGLILATRFEVG